VINEETQEKRTDKLSYHGCEKDLAQALSTSISVVCNGHTNSCYNVSQADIPDDFIVSAEACFCDGDRCNDKNPDLPDNNVPSKSCYDCGYKCTAMVDETCTPEPIDEEGKINFCGDIASMETYTKDCTGEDECCGAIREYFQVTNEETGVVTTDMMTYHGCEKDLAAAVGGKVDVVCNDHTDSCYNVTRGDIHDDLIIDAKACFCEGTRCNKGIPDLPFPSDGSMGHTIMASTLVLLFSGLPLLFH